MKKLEHGVNMGVIIKVRPEDFLAGAESSVIYRSVNPSGDWEVYNPTNEWQRRKDSNTLGYDTNSCITFSALNSVEMQITRLLEMGELTTVHRAQMQELGYFDENGKLNFSEWFSAIVNGTSVNGNYLQAPWDSFRKDGILPQIDGKRVNDFKTNEEWLDPAGITPEMRAKAKKFLDIFDVKYEWVTSGQPYQWKAMAKHLQHAPLHVVHPTCGNWNQKTGVVAVCEGVTRCNHATLVIGQDWGKFHKDLDHYDPFVKKLAWDYYIPYAIKGVITVKKPVVETPFTYVYKVNLRYGSAGTPEVHALQRGLQTLKMASGDAYLSKGVYGPFGPVTRRALALFQLDNGIVDPDGMGMNFGPRTRTVMTEKLNAIHT